MGTAVAADPKRAERLRLAILRRAFAGQRVPQDPSDGPAGALLDRIQAERAGGGKPTKARQGRNARQPTV